MPKDTAKRIYGEWAGRPEGYPEDPECCIAEVGYQMRFMQCANDRGKGPRNLFCGTHARMIANGKMPFLVSEDKKWVTALSKAS